jgi:FKBP-type peptidyl-prolyl cis-trans isomerase FkpA
MKRIILIGLVLTGTIGFAQTGSKPATKPAAKPATKPSGPIMKNIIDSASYAIGVNVATFYKQQGITQLNSSLILKGCNDVLGNKPIAFDDNTANRIMSGLMNSLQENKAQATIKEGETFLKNNKSKPGVKVTASGLQYEVLRDTVGYKPTVKDTFVVHYRGTLLNGTEFDNSYNRGEPLVYPMNKVIPGWTEGLQMMSIGSKYKLYVPYQLGYGLYGNEPAIPGGAVLVFEMELLDVKKYKGPNQ